MRHHDEDAAVGGSEAIVAVRCAVGVGGVGFGGLMFAIDVAEGDFVVRGDVGVVCEYCISRAASASISAVKNSRFNIKSSAHMVSFK